MAQKFDLPNYQEKAVGDDSKMTQQELDHFRELGPSGRNLIPSSFIGISTLPDQFVNLKLRKGFQFNILCVGCSGVGKTSLLHTLFRLPLKDEPHPTRSEEVSLSITEYDLKEANVSLKLTFVETRGFGDQIDKSSSSQPIVEYIEKQNRAYLNEECKLKRSLDTYIDKRIHACIYMIAPTGHCLSALDIMTMKKLHNKVNLIPIIGKADIMTKRELKDFKQRILRDIHSHEIQIYQFPLDDPNISEKNNDMNNIMPFAVISSVEEEMVNNQLCRVRKYPWGIVNVDDENHCEFQHLREMVLRANLYDLIRVTHTKFYENYRHSILVEGGSVPVDPEMTENLQKKREEIMQNSNRQIQQLKENFDRQVSSMTENFKISENEMEHDFQKNLKDVEERKAAAINTTSDTIASVFEQASHSFGFKLSESTRLKRAESISRELKRFKSIYRQHSSILTSFSVDTS